MTRILLHARQAAQLAADPDLAVRQLRQIIPQIEAAALDRQMSLVFPARLHEGVTKALVSYGYTTQEFQANSWKHIHTRIAWG